ncbi:uncharacterized protein LOC127705289 [Mytilus californianus]|uniref:uncharacterized protein LOC127705289 n=1 Tax=Mytilus californianus TaxID=6549 RepID=UPI0022458B89|nr:uncharacterized protein LOC127705289 [Mytilus californianus]
MALSTEAKEQDNFLRYMIMIVDHSKEALQDLVKLDLKNKNLTFEEFLNKNQHEIYHLCYDSKCCQCHNLPPRRKRIIFPSQLELLFDKYKKLPPHKGIGHNDYCCTYAIAGITSQVLDLSLARCLLVNCCLDVFWYTCLNAQGQTLEQFLNRNKHTIYHLCKNNQNCCQCPPGYIFPCDGPIIDENKWKGMFRSVLLPCINDRKLSSTGTTSVCSVAAKSGIDVKDIHPEIQGLILKWCCSVRISVEKLVECRNLNFGHASNAKLSDNKFEDLSKETEECILDIARTCGKTLEVKNAISHLRSRPLDARLCSHYQNILLENINRNETINENVISEHQKTREKVSCTLKNLEDRIKSLETSSIENRIELNDLRKLLTDNSKRSRLLDQTSAEIEIHERNGKYLEVGAVRHCVQLLESRNVVVLSGREGSGKSRNGLEILRQLKGQNRDFEVFKLIGLNYVYDIFKSNVTSIVFIDDAFDKTSEQYSYDKHILDHLYSNISLNKVKFIFTMRNTVKHANQKILTTHILFHDLVDIDLNSEQFELTSVEKENMLTKRCIMNTIMISKGEDDETGQPVLIEADRNQTEAGVLDRTVVVLKRDLLNEIIQTDPFLGFPECCRMFTEIRNTTAALDAFCFKWPPPVLVNDIEQLRMEGKDNYISGLKYVTLIYLLTLGKFDNLKNICGLAKKNINVETCKQIYDECYTLNQSNVAIQLSDIDHVCKILIDRYLVNRDGIYYFQQKAVKDSVLISYSKINLKAIIPLLTLDHIVDLVCLQSYMEHDDEIVIKISKDHYKELAKKIVILMNSVCSYHERDFDRMTQSKLMRENDVNFISQLILCLCNENDTLLSPLSLHLRSCITPSFVLYVLRTSGNHLNYNDRSISVRIDDKILILPVYPNLFRNRF